MIIVLSILCVPAFQSIDFFDFRITFAFFFQFLLTMIRMLDLIHHTTTMRSFLFSELKEHSSCNAKDSKDAHKQSKDNEIGPRVYGYFND